ncbi:hypothetical protein J6590_093282 [Homalodisca vitripennis]|nr:hypothetical protein J6590_093282 [Homalodisca vitripennis]
MFAMRELVFATTMVFIFRKEIRRSKTLDFGSESEIATIAFVLYRHYSLFCLIRSSHIPVALEDGSKRFNRKEGTKTLFHPTQPKISHGVKSGLRGGQRNCRQQHGNLLHRAVRAVLYHLESKQSHHCVSRRHFKFHARLPRLYLPIVYNVPQTKRLFYKKPSLTLNLGTNGLKVTSEPPPMAGQAGCLQGQDRSAVTYPSSSHARRCLIWLSCDNRRTRYTAPLATTHKKPTNPMIPNAVILDT